jgi:hypothetical protein
LPIPTPAPTPADVRTALAATGRAANPESVEAICRVIAACGCIDHAAAVLAHEEAHGLLTQLLAYRTAVAEQCDPALRVARLYREAADLDSRAEPIWAESAEFAGKAAYRRLHGETDLAALFQRRSDAAERVAADLEAQAFARRLQAANMLACLSLRAGLSATLRTIAA